MLEHTIEVSPYINEHKEQLHQDNPDQNEAWLAMAHMKGFNIWFRDRINKSSSYIDEGLRNLASGPLFTVTIYQGYDINGYTFYTMAQDKKSMY